MPLKNNGFVIIFNYNVLTLNRRIKEVFYIIINLNVKDIISL